MTSCSTLTVKGPTGVFMRRPSMPTSALFASTTSTLPVNRLHVGMMAGLIAALVFIVLFLPGLFSLSPLSFGGYLILILFTLLIPSVIWLLNKALEGLLLLLQKAEGGKRAA